MREGRDLVEGVGERRRRGGERAGPGGAIAIHRPDADLGERVLKTGELDQVVVLPGALMIPLRPCTVGTASRAKPRNRLVKGFSFAPPGACS